MFTKNNIPGVTFFDNCLTQIIVETLRGFKIL